ncbi:MAG: hypothetical protein IJY28_07845, partial [Clostridia bacterium]|nr:hypothetical protein [Clostridia bacterium]
KGHAIAGWTTVAEPTCTEPGSKTVTCSRCDYSETREIPANGHSYKAKVSAATCTEGGYTSHTCSVCNHNYADNKTEALGHDITSWTTVTPPTCTEPGSQTGTCSRCDHSETKEIPAKGHSETSVVTPPTCTAEGYTTYTCTVCGAVRTDNKTAALGHKIDSWTTTKEPGCATEGSQTGTCIRCDYSETKPIPAKGHSETSVVTPPTCTTEGYTTYTCTVCGAVRTDNKTAALGHKIDSWTTTKEPGCATEGSQTGTCTRCDYSETKPIPAKGHSYTSVVTKPTCTEEGYTTHTCACGDSYTDGETPALGHDFGEWKVTQKPTYTATGTERRTCTRCSHYEERSIPKKPLPDAFSVKADNKDVTSSFKKNEHIVTGTVVYTVTKLTVSITEYGVNNTITFNFNDADGVKVSNGIRYTFTLPLVHDVDGRPITDYYTIRVVQVPAPVSSRPASSSKPSSAPESEMPPSSESPSSSVMPSEPEEPSSSEVPSVPEKPSSSKAPVTSQDNTAGRMDWMLPAAILMGVLCAAGILYVIGQLLVSYGLLGKKQPDDTDDADNMIDLFKQDPVDTDSELDEIFHNKK